MIYEFQATQDLHGYSKPWAPGTSINMLDFVNLIAGTPSNTASSAATARLWTDGTYVPGLTSGNFYVPNNISSISKTSDSIKFSSLAASYGVALVCPKLTVGDTYTVSYDKDPTIVQYLNSVYYDEDGTFLSTSATSTTNSLTFTVPDDTAYVLILLRSGVSNVVVEFKNIMIEEGSTASSYVPYANVCMPEGFNIWDPTTQEYVQVYAGYVNSNTRELYLRPVYDEYAGEELVGPWMSSWDPYEEDTTPTEGAFVIDFGGELTSFEITPFMLQTLLDSLGIRQHFTDGAGLLNSLMDQAQGRVRSEAELLHLSRPLKVIAIGDQLPAGLKFKPISKDVLPGLPGKFIR